MKTTLNVEVSPEWVEGLLAQKIASAGMNDAVQMARYIFGIIDAERRIETLTQYLMGCPLVLDYKVGDTVISDSKIYQTDDINPERDLVEVGVCKVVWVNPYEKYTTYTVEFEVPILKDGEKSTRVQRQEVSKYSLKGGSNG